MDRTAALKALLTWVDLGVLKEESGNVFTLLEKSQGFAVASSSRSCTHLHHSFPNPMLIIVYSTPSNNGSAPRRERPATASGADENLLESKS